MGRVNRFLSALALPLALLLGACGGGSSDTAPAPPPPSTANSTSISEADAVARAQAAAADGGYSVEGLDVNPAQIFGEWQVSFEPVATGSLSGGFLVVLDAETGDLIDLVPYQ